MKKTMKVIIALVVMGLLYLEGVSLYIVDKFSHPKALNYECRPSDYGIEDFERVSFDSAKKDLTLNGYFLESPGSEKTIIMCHGYECNQYGIKIYIDEVLSQMDLAKELTDRGYNVLVFDFRGHGENAEKTKTTINFDEQKDLLGAIEFVKSRGAEEIGVFGFSAGAATSLSVLDKTDDVDFVIADSPFSDLEGYLKGNMSLWTGFPDMPYTYGVLLNMKMVQGVRFKEASPVKSVSRSDVPILVIHGEKDVDIPCSESVKISESFNNEKSRLELLDYAAHCTAFVDDREDYMEIVDGFLSDIGK